MLAYIWAEDLNGGIGIDGHLPWHISNDLKRFKKITSGHPMVMGRKTFESLPGILPGRKHIVLTRSDLKVDNSNVEIVHSRDELDNWIKSQDQLVVIIGGATLFRMYRDQVDILYKTVVKKAFTTDTKMPQIDYSKFKMTAHQCFDDDQIPYEFFTYQRK